jgi:tripartite-type tricarboxylate transporter receptor subunit TctC
VETGAHRSFCAAAIEAAWAPDGYSLLFANAANAVNATLYQNLKFDFIRDIASVASIGNIPLVMAVNSLLLDKSVPELIGYAKANPNKINMTSAGTGSVSDVFGALFTVMAGVHLNHVPHRINFIAELVSGQVQVAFTTTTLSIEYIRLCHALHGAAGHPNGGRIRTGLRRGWLVRRWCA